MLRTSFSFPWAYYVCLLSCFNGALAYQGRGFSFLKDKIVSCTRGGFLSIFIVGGTFASFCFVTLVGVLAVILHSFVTVSFSLRYAHASEFWLFYVALFFAEVVQP